jgi:hypothetical protein
MRQLVVAGLDDLLSRRLVVAAMSHAQEAGVRALREYWQSATSEELTRLKGIYERKAGESWPPRS